MVKNNSFKKIVGGIGDFLQGADSAIAEKEIKVYSHAKNASDFFSGLGVKAHLQYFKEIEEIYPMEEKDDLSRHLFYNFTPPEKSVELAYGNIGNQDHVIGIHPLGSAFWNQHVKKQDIPIQKIIEPDAVRSLINLFDKHSKIVIFGAPHELEIYKNELKDIQNIVWVDYENIWDSLCHVLFCHLVIAMDSCIKSMSSGLRIPSIVFVPNTHDPFRDQLFIDPYVDQGVMNIIKYNTIGDIEVDKVKNLI